jgi:hypothetical protein
MPRRPWLLWSLTALVLAVFPAVNFIYWPQVLRSGVLPPDGDSIGIPMFGSVLITVVASPLVLGIAWLCLRRYNPETRLAAWRQDRPYRSAFATLAFITAAALASGLAIATLTPDAPWYEYLWPVYFALWVPWLLALRAAAVEQLDYEPTYTEAQCLLSTHSCHLAPAIEPRYAPGTAL